MSIILSPYTLKNEHGNPKNGGLEVDFPLKNSVIFRFQMGVNPKIGVIIYFNRVFHYKPIHFGGPPLFLETPKCEMFRSVPDRTYFTSPYSWIDNIIL